MRIDTLINTMGGRFLIQRDQKPFSPAEASEIIKNLTDPDPKLGLYDLCQSAPNGVSDEEVIRLTNYLEELRISDAISEEKVTTEALKNLAKTPFQGDYMLMILQERALDLLNLRREFEFLGEIYAEHTSHDLSPNETYPVYSRAFSFIPSFVSVDVDPGVFSTSA